jgi:hypothetical protein
VTSGLTHALTVLPIFVISTIFCCDMEFMNGVVFCFQGDSWVVPGVVERV